MTDPQGPIAVGRVGRAHGLDGSFYVDAARHRFDAGTPVSLEGMETVVESRGGTDARPLVRLAGIGDRASAAALRGKALRVPAASAPLEDGEWAAEDLVGCTVPGLGLVRRVVSGPSCDLLMVGEDEVLVPFIRDAIRRVDPAARTIEVDHGFLGLSGAGGAQRVDDDPPGVAGP